MIDLADIWNEGTEEIRFAICDHLGWPRQYAKGEANREWLTKGQLGQLHRMKGDDIDSVLPALRWDAQLREWELGQ